MFCANNLRKLRKKKGQHLGYVTEGGERNKLAKIRCSEIYIRGIMNSCRSSGLIVFLAFVSCG